MVAPIVLFLDYVVVLDMLCGKQERVDHGIGDTCDEQEVITVPRYMYLP